MSRSLFSLIIKTRFTTAYLVLFGLILAYAFLEASFFPSSIDVGLVSRLLVYVVLGLLVFFTVLFGLNSSYPIIRSDTDFLFTSPISKRGVAFALYVSKYLFVGVVFLITNLYIVGIIAPTPFLRVFVIIDTIVSSLLITSLSISISKLSVVKKMLALSGVSGWELFSLLGLGFSPASYIFGQVYSGTAMLLALAAILTFVAYRQLMYADIDSLKLTITGVRRQRERKNVSESSKRIFDNIDPRKAMLVFNLTKTSIVSSRRSFASDRSIGVHRGLGLLALLAVGVVAGGALFIISYYFHAVSGILELYIFVGMYSLMFLFAFSYNALSTERAWTSFTSVKPGMYIRYVIYGRIIRSMAITYPMGVSAVLIYVLFHVNILGLAIVDFVDAPLMVVLLVMTTMIVGVFQIKDPEYVTPQRNVKQILYAPVSITGMVVGAVSVFFFLISVYMAVAIAAVSLIFLFYPKILNFAVFRMIEKGFT